MNIVTEPSNEIGIERTRRSFRLDHGAALLRLMVPVLLGGLFWLIHQLVPNGQNFFGGAVFNRVFAGIAVFYSGLLLVAAWRRNLRLKLVEKSPLISAALGLTIIWELVTLKLAWLPLPFFPSPAAVLSVLVTDWQTLGLSALYSLRLLAIGFLIGLLLGLPTGILMGWYPRFNYWLTPVLRLIGPIPATAWIPIAMAVFPTSFMASIFLISLAVWFPVTVMAWSGIANVNKAYYDVARTLGADERFLITKVALPAALPTIFVGVFMGLGTSFVTLVVGELLGVKAGLGWYIQWAQGWAEYSKVYAALLVMALVFSGIISLLFKFRNKVLAWQKGLIKW